MLFNSLDFVILVLATFMLYYLPLLQSFQIVILILSSFVFYAYNQPYLLTLLIFSSSINTVTSYLTEHFKQKRLFASFGVWGDFKSGHPVLIQIFKTLILFFILCGYYPFSFGEFYHLNSAANWHLLFYLPGYQPSHWCLSKVWI